MTTAVPSQRLPSRGARSRSSSSRIAPLRHGHRRPFPTSDVDVEFVHQPARARAGPGRGRRGDVAVAAAPGRCRGCPARRRARRRRARAACSSTHGRHHDLAPADVDDDVARDLRDRGRDEGRVRLREARGRRPARARPPAPARGRRRTRSGTRTSSPIGDRPSRRGGREREALVEVERGAQRLEVELEVHHRDARRRAGCRR